MQSPTDFSKYNPNTRRHAEYFLQKYKDLFTWGDSEDILEIGCADGSITREVLYPFIKNNLNRLLAADISAQAIDAANSTNENAKITFRVMDLGNEKEGENYEGKFDKIFAFYCFHLVKPAEVWPKNIYKMLKEGGQVFGTIAIPDMITDVMKEQLAETAAPWNKHIQNRPSPLTTYGPKPTETISKILTEAGFYVNTIEIKAMPSSFKVKEHLTKTMLSYCFFMKYVPDNLKECYKEDYLRRMYQHITIDENGYYCYTMDAVGIVATKQ